MTAPGRLRAEDVHRVLDGQWRHVLGALGIDDAYFTGKHGPCPMCGGRDRWRFTDHHDAGMWICNNCGSGDGIALVMAYHGWSFTTALHEIAATAALQGTEAPRPAHRCRERSHASESCAPASPTARVRALRRSTAVAADVADAAAYLQSRHLWPLPAGCALRAHAGAEYWSDGTMIGRFPALVADVVDIEAELVTTHITYVPGGRKLQGHAPRKILSPMSGRRGCAVRLIPADGDVLGIAEGIETALAAARIHDVPTWAALNAGMLGRFIPPPEIATVLIFADADRAGFEAAWKLAGELDGRCATELRLPPAPAKDWAEMLEGRS